MEWINCAAAHARAVSARSEVQAIGWGRALERATCQASVARRSDAGPSDDAVRSRNVEEDVAANLVAAIEVVSHVGFSCERRMMAAWSGRQGC